MGDERTWDPGQQGGWQAPPGAEPPGRQGDWQPPPGGGPPQRQAPRTNGLAIAALICGLVALPLAIVLVGGLLGVLAVILGIVGLAKVRETGSGRGLAIAGIVAGVLAVLLSIALLVFAVRLFQDAEFQELLEGELERQEQLLEEQGQDN